MIASIFSWLLPKPVQEDKPFAQVIDGVYYSISPDYSELICWAPSKWKQLYRTKNGTFFFYIDQSSYGPSPRIDFPNAYTVLEFMCDCMSKEQLFKYAKKFNLNIREG